MKCAGGLEIKLYTLMTSTLDESGQVHTLLTLLQEKGSSVLSEIRHLDLTCT